MIKILGCIVIIKFIFWSCIKVGAQSDKLIEKEELERPDLIQFQSNKNA